MPSAIRIVAHTGTAIAGALVLLLLAFMIPSLISRQPSETVSSGLSGSTHNSCEIRPTKAVCNGTASKTSRRRAAESSTALAPRAARAPLWASSRSQTGSVPSQRRLSSTAQPSSSPTPKPQNTNGYSPPRSIPSDCSRDVTPAMNAWIASVPDNSSLVLPSGACYRIDGTLQIMNRTGLTISGNGTTFSGQHHTAGKLPHIGVYGSKNITFTDLTVKGANPHAGLYEDAFQAPLQWEAAWGIEGSDGILLDSVQAYDVFGDFVTIQPRWVGQTPVTSRNITIRNSRFQRNGRMGIAITGGETITVTNNYISDIRHALLNLEPEWPALPIDNVRFTGNTTGGVWLLWIANGGICNAGVSNIYVADNLMTADAGIPLLQVIPRPGCQRRGPFTIERNTLIARGSMYAAFDLTMVHDVMVRQNKLLFYHDDRTRVLVNLRDSTRVSVVDNRVTADPRDTVVFVTADPGSDYVQSGNVRV